MKLQLKSIESDICVVEMQHKPILATALEHPKIRDYPQAIKNENTFIIFSWMLDLLGVKGSTHTDGHHDIAITFIHSSLSGYTYQEITLAFQMYVRGDFNSLLVTQQLNAVVIGRVMRAYDHLKKNDLNIYRSEKSKQMALAEKKEYTSQEKELLMFINMLNYWEQYKITNEVGIGGQVLFDRFLEKGILGHPCEKIYKRYYAKKMQEAKEILLNQHQNNRYVYSDVNQYKQILNNLKSGMGISIENKAKCLVIEAYFQKLTTEKKELQDVLRQHWGYQTKY